MTRTRHVGPKQSCRSAQSTSEKIVGGICKFQEKQWSYRTGVERVRVLGGNDKTWARVCGQMLGTFQECSEKSKANLKIFVCRLVC